MSVFKRKRRLSPHQKQMRFFMVALILLVIPLTILIFWALSRPSF